MKLIFLSILLVLSSATAISKVYDCEDSIDARMKITNSFDSSIPALESTRITYNPDGTVQSVKKNIYLSQDTACGIDANFQNDCSFTEKENELGYSFKFICSKQKIKGNIYIDETGFMQLQCSNQDRPSMFCY